MRAFAHVIWPPVVLLYPFSADLRVQGCYQVSELCTHVQDMAEERAKVANANYIASRRWEAVVERRTLYAQVSHLSGFCTLVEPGSLASVHSRSSDFCRFQEITQ
jgi:hypothetical protein